MNHEERVLSKIPLIHACFDGGVDRGTGIIKAAELAVKWEAEMFAEGFNAVYDFTNDPEFGPDIIKGQLERGLIPPQTQTV